MLRRVSLATVVLTLLLAATAHAAVISPPLRTSGAKIVDRNGHTVVLQGVNWFGFETSAHVVHGLWSRDLDDMMGQVRRMGFNTIRLPFSLQALDSNVPITGPDFSGGKNAALQGKTPQQAMDVVIDAAARAGLMVLLENHSLADDGYSYGLWYGQAGYDENAWVARWQALARRYKDKTNVIGADLKNEPHGDATWGTGGPTDWQRAATRAGNAVTAIAPNWLIVVEGIEKPVAGGKLDDALVGRQPRGRAPRIRCGSQRANRLVYSPHEYGPGVFPQPWFGRAGHRAAPRAALARRLGLHRRAGHRAAADRRVRRPQGRPRQRRGPLAASVPRPPRAHRHLVDLLGAESRLRGHRWGPVRRLDDAGRPQARPAAAHDPAPAHRVRRRGRGTREPRPPGFLRSSLTLNLRVRMG